MKELKPLRKHVVLQIEPEDRKGSLSLVKPDEDSIMYCSRCGKLTAALKDNACWPQPIWEYDSRGFPVQKGEDFTHVIETITAPAMPSTTRVGKVVALNDVDAVQVGDRVLIPALSGKVANEWEALFGEAEYRVVREEALLGMVE